MASKILVIEDDAAFLEATLLFLQTAGYEGKGGPDGFRGLDLLASWEPDLILLDMMLPGGKGGMEICQEIRQTNNNIPIIMVTAMTDKEIIALEAGADDFVPKTSGHATLKAHIDAALRRFRWSRDETQGDTIVIGPLTIDIVGHDVRRGDEKVGLTPLEFNLLCTLAAKPNKVFSREDLLEKVWGYRYKSDTRLVNVHIQRLRSKIEDDPENPRIVLTERGVGYRAGSF